MTLPRRARHAETHTEHPPGEWLSQPTSQPVRARMAVQGDGMERTIQRRVPLVGVTGREETAALVECLRAQGAVVYQARTPAGCLRVATAVRPDAILLP